MRISTFIAALLFAAVSHSAVLRNGALSNAVITNNPTAAVQWTVANNALCSTATVGTNFYYEIDTASGTQLISGVQSGTPLSSAQYTATSLMQLDSASKMMYMTLFAQLRGVTGNQINWQPGDIDYLHQLSGFTNAPSACGANTIIDCSKNEPGVASVITVGSTTPGTGYSGGPYIAQATTTNSVNGSGAKLTASVVGGGLYPTKVFNGGSGYVDGDALFLTVGGGTGFQTLVTQTSCDPVIPYTLTVDGSS